MENLQKLSSKDLNRIYGGILWVPLAVAAGKFVGGVVAGYVATEVVHGVAKGIAGGEYVTCGEQ